MNFIKALIISVLFVTMLFVSTIVASKVARADDYHVIDLNELSLDYKNYKMVNANSHNMLIWPTPPKESINVNIKLDLFKYFYWDSIIESLTNDAKYASIGLDTRLGVRLSDYLELGLYHHSQHVLDRTYDYMNGHYPEEDAVEIKLYLFRKDKRESLF